MICRTFEIWNGKVGYVPWALISIRDANNDLTYCWVV